MPVIKFTALGGLEPSVPPRALPDNGAQVVAMGKALGLDDDAMDALWREAAVL